MNENTTIFGIPDYIEKNNNNDFFLNYEVTNSSNNIIELLENAEISELEIIKTKYQLEESLIYEYKIKKDTKLIENLVKKDFFGIYNRLVELGVIPEENLYKNAYSKILKIQPGEEEPTPQSVVYVVFAAGVFVAVGAVYVALVHSAGAGVNVRVGANLWTYVSIKSSIYGYSTESKLLNIIKSLFPKFSFSNLDLDEYMNREEQEKLFKFILEESAEKMKKELVSQKYNLSPLHIYS